jgi:hypothetical protein
LESSKSIEKGVVDFARKSAEKKIEIGILMAEKKREEFVE